MSNQKKFIEMTFRQFEYFLGDVIDSVLDLYPDRDNIPDDLKIRLYQPLNNLIEWSIENRLGGCSDAE